MFDTESISDKPKALFEHNFDHAAFHHFSFA
jgi:hypothetical protein